MQTLATVASLAIQSLDQEGPYVSCLVVVAIFGRFYLWLLTRCIGWVDPIFQPPFSVELAPSTSDDQNISLFRKAAENHGFKGGS
jgi:hypothetical protein